ncbi:MAG: glycine betaine ABC transporter substrate-binding protein [Bacteroidales bacterium]|jgi:glycine betaine/proline transport system substrate-binding protein|nr:glycine betaine ABC transporter substrate-binding protein [Bacteroidales bacterium]
MMKFKNLISFALIVGLFVSLTACTNSDDGKEKVSILYPNWVEAVAYSYLSKVVLEEKGYNVELTNLEPGLIYGELSKENSKGDVFLDAWLPNTHADYWEIYGDKLVKLGESFSEGTTGLVVPSYVTINSIEELNANKDKFSSEIIGIGSGAGIHRDTERAIEAYGLELDQITSSGPAMVASLQRAARNEDWIVITGWKPHFKWANHDLKYLEDPKGIYPMDVCAILSRRGFEEDMPKVADFFKKFNLTEDELYGLMASIDENGNEEGARIWYEANKEMVDSWYEN